MTCPLSRINLTATFPKVRVAVMCDKRYFGHPGWTPFMDKFLTGMHTGYARAHIDKKHGAHNCVVRFELDDADPDHRFYFVRCGDIILLEDLPSEEVLKLRWGIRAR